MKITLIAPILFDLGLYTLAPQLKACGHDVDLLFVPQLMQDSPRRLSKACMSRICEFASGSDLVGISCISENYYNTAELADSIKEKTGVRLIWGGVCATLHPQECLKHADMVCIGEGEKAIVELADNLQQDGRPSRINNIISRDETLRPYPEGLDPPSDLNALRPFDYDLDSQFVTQGNNIRNVDEKDFRGNFLTYSSRGCPFRCSYCCNAFMADLYRGHAYCRQRNIENVIGELKVIKQRFSSCRSIWFNEADFLCGKPQELIEDFAHRYKEEIDIPFGIWTNPNAINRQAITALKQAGLKGVNIGTINANTHIQKGVYNRSADSRLYQNSAEVLNECGIDVEYDFILSNPYESASDINRTIGLLFSLPKPFRTVIYSLTYFPGTELFKRGVKDKIIDEHIQPRGYTGASYKVWEFKGNDAYLNAVASLMRGKARKAFGIHWYGLMPEPALKFLASRPMVRLFNCMPFRSFFAVAISRFMKTVYRIAK